MGNYSKLDVVMAQAFRHLCEDFRDGAYWDVPLEMGNLPIRHLRSYKWPSCAGYRPYCFRAIHQLKHFFDRYRFEHDVYSDNELHNAGVEKFLNTQLSVAKPLTMSSGTKIILQRARKLVKEILGPYDKNACLSLCDFSKRATVWSPLAKSYLDLKLGRLSGSMEHLSLFKSYLKTDPLLQNCVTQYVERRGEWPFASYDVLKVTFVPKSWKSLRSITPNTTVGSFLSSGLGDFIAKRLKEYGLDLSNLQPRQRAKAKKASVRRHLVTADLSAASDSFGNDLVNLLVPRQWYRALKLGRIGRVKIKGIKDHVHLTSFMTMGIGFTFPLQTLLFYAILESIRAALFPRLPKGDISVFGDDLIYPVVMHGVVSTVLRECRFSLNSDKTFASGWFRESCGGDYLEGVDVRPAMPDVPSVAEDELTFISYLYKIYNALSARWEDVEIPKTLEYLRTLIFSVQGSIFYVPQDYPAYSGICVKCLDPSTFHQVERVTRGGVEMLKFRCIREVNGERQVEPLPYLWLKLSTLDRPWTAFDWRGQPAVEVIHWRKFKKRRFLKIDEKGKKLFEKLIFYEPVTSLKSPTSCKVADGFCIPWQVM